MKEKKLNAEILRKYIFGGHVADYMKKMQEDDSAKFNAHFSHYVKKGIKGDQLEATWKKVHAAIRAKPEFVKSTRGKPKDMSKYPKKQLRLNLEQRRAAIKVKFSKISAQAEEEE